MQQSLQPATHHKEGGKTRSLYHKIRKILASKSLITGIPMLPRSREHPNFAEYVMAYLRRMAERNVVLTSFTHKFIVSYDRLVHHILGHLGAYLPDGLRQEQVLNFSMDACEAHALMTDEKHNREIGNWMHKDKFLCLAGGYLDKTITSPEHFYDIAAHRTALYIVALCCLKNVSVERHALLSKFGGPTVNPVLTYQDPADDLVISKGTAHNLLNRSMLELQENVTIRGAYFTNCPYWVSGDILPLGGSPPLQERMHPVRQCFMIRGVSHNLPETMERFLRDMQHGLKEDNDKLLVIVANMHIPSGASTSAGATIASLSVDVLRMVKEAMIREHVDAFRWLLADDPFYYEW